MTANRIPLIPTLLVLAAVAVMIRLGFWQLDRLEQKEAMLARYTAARAMTSEVPWPHDDAAAQGALYRRTRLDCRSPGPDQPLAGHNSAGETGWVHSFQCLLADGGSAQVAIGWSRDPAARQWPGGTVAGWVAPGAGNSVRLLADPPQGGLEANASPDPANVPNNHLSYAVQWFLFAATALVIYALALRKRLAAA